jgi:pyruvate dehydrogenase E2 component (dihydrolipoamide acetyltransferase)
MSQSNGPSNGDRVIAFTKIRRIIAQRMASSKSTAAHTLMARELDYERVEQVRRTHGDQFRSDEGFGLSYLTFSACATVQALGEYPLLNSSVGDDELIVHKSINLGIAVDLERGGLVVPVVHDAHGLTLREMARRIRDVAVRARSAKLTLDDISNGTFTITNTGPFGTFLTGAVINLPEVAILATDGVSRRPVVEVSPEGVESVVIRSMGLASINFDHRALDGAYVARFLARLGQILEERRWTDEL